MTPGRGSSRPGVPLSESETAALNNVTVTFEATAPRDGAHGPVRVRNRFHFGYADGTPYYPFGTTCYAWAHQGDELESLTLGTLAEAPFTKMRMCVFPKDYTYNKNEPEYYPFQRTAGGANDFTRFDPAFWRHFETRVGQLRDVGIEADDGNNLVPAYSFGSDTDTGMYVSGTALGLTYGGVLEVSWPEGGAVRQIGVAELVFDGLLVA